MLDLYYNVAIFNRRCGSVLTRLVLQSFQLEMRKCTSRTRLVLQSSDFRAGAAEVYFAYYTCTTNLRFSRCGSVLRVLGLHYKVAILELELRKCTLRTRLVLQSFELEMRKCTSRTRLVLHPCDFRAGTRLVLQSCDFRAGAAEVYFAYWTCTTKLRFSAGAAEVYFAY